MSNFFMQLFEAAGSPDHFKLPGSSIEICRGNDGFELFHGAIRIDTFPHLSGLVDRLEQMPLWKNYMAYCMVKAHIQES